MVKEARVFPNAVVISDVGAGPFGELAKLSEFDRVLVGEIGGFTDVVLEVVELV